MAIEILQHADVVAGDLVCVREGVWRVMEVRTFAPDRVARTRVLKLIGADALNRWQPCTLLEPFDRPRRVEAARAARVVSRARWMRTFAALAAASPPIGCPATIADAQVTLLPHQIDPVLAVLRGRASRLLLADAVGLGKTIQAALLVRELRGRGCADRVLVLVPSGLREQWRQELLHRTGLRADIIDAAALVARVRDLPPDVNPWSLPGILIVSLDFIKQPSVLRGAGSIVWDVLIADEAHNLNEGTARLAAADLLARHSRHVVLLTATPHHGSDDAFAALCRIGRIDRDPIVIFRRTRHTIGLSRTRKVHVLRVTPTKQERRLHMLLARYAGRVERDQGGDVSGINMTDGDGAASLTTASLAMSILLKRASSSAWSLERSLRRRLSLLDGRALPDDHARTQFVLPFANAGADADDNSGGDAADSEPSHVLGAPGLRSARIERAWLTLLIEVARNAARDESKPRALVRFLRRCREPALIYTEYRDTLTHLARTLASTRHGLGTRNVTASAAAPLAMLHGGLGVDERRNALARFTSGDARILLTTDAAGEGLNLHHRCRLVINVELPWNPNRLEQRIGRVDRLGQTRTVHAMHLVAADTAEDPMLTRLTTRIAQIAATLGDAPTILHAPREADSAEADVRTEVLASTASDAPIACRTVSAEAIDVIAQLQRLRALRARAWRAARPHPTSAATSRGDPLLALDERAPLIAVVRRRHFDRRDQPRMGGARELSAPGLLCVWRTRLPHRNGQPHTRDGPASQLLTTVLTAIHIACDVPQVTSHRAVAAFVSATVERCSARIGPLLDSELTTACERLEGTDRARLDRLARRDEAIAIELAAMSRAGAASDGMFQPLLFDDIAVEKASPIGEPYASSNGYHVTRSAMKDVDVMHSLDETDDTQRVESSLLMALVLR